MKRQGTRIPQQTKCSGIIIIFVAILFTCALTLLPSCATNPDTQYATGIAKDYQDMLKNPDSMVIRGDVTIVDSINEDGTSTKFCYFEVSAENGLGGTVVSVPLYEDGQYQTDAIEDFDRSDYSPEEALHLASIRYQWATWVYEKMPEEGVSIVSGKTVARAIGAEYYE